MLYYSKNSKPLFLEKAARIKFNISGTFSNTLNLN
jgi:hypothetical protein